MTEHYQITKEHTPEPLHEVLLSVGKSWMQWPGSRLREPLAPNATSEKSTSAGVIQDSNLVEERARRAVISQLATALKLRGVEAEVEVMLSSLESLATAGEISFRDYVGRVQNLFPNLLNTLDVTLRMKIVSMMVD